MTPILNGVLAVSGSLAASIVAKGTVVVALAFAGVWGARHAVLAAAFVVLALLPIAAIVVPAVQIALPAVAQNEAARPPLEVATSAAPSAVAVDAAVGGAPAIPHSSGFPAFALLLAVWAIGAVLCLLPMAAGLWQVRSLRRRGLPWRRGQSVVKSLALDAGIHRHVAVLLSEALPGPATCGAVRPAIMLPLDARTWKQEDLDRVVVHELEHVRRGDWASCCLARAVCAVYWFHPLVWIAWRRLALEAERSCDDAVLRRAEATAYADQLVGFAQRLAAAPPSPLLAMASPADLATRVRAVLDSRQRRGRVGTLSVALAAAAAAVLVTTMSPLRIVAAAQSSAAQAGAPHFKVASVKINLAAPGPRNYDETVSPTRLHFQDFTLQDLLKRAFGVKDYQLPGTDKLKKERYDITAITAAPTPPPTMMLMLLQLLVDRFHLRFHRETRPLPGYLLVVGKHGLNLSPIPPGDSAPATGWPSNPKLTLLQARSRPYTNSPIGNSDGSRILSGHMTLGDLADEITYSGFAGRPVFDRTGISTVFDLTLRFTPDTGIGVRPKSFDARPAVYYPSLAAAMQEQLGLKLDPANVPTPMVVIDGVETTPTPN